MANFETIELLPYLKEMEYEYCAHCDDEVIIEKSFEAQECPQCREIILPCGDCIERNCNECPLARQAEGLKMIKKMGEYELNVIKEEVEKAIKKHEIQPTIPSANNINYWKWILPKITKQLEKRALQQ